MKFAIKCALSVSAILSLIVCSATEVKTNTDATSSGINVSGQAGEMRERSIKLLSAIDYLEKEISNSPTTLFYNAKRENLPASAKEDFIAMIRNEKNRLSEFPSGVYIKIARTLQDGYINAPCNSGGSLNLRCIDFSRFLLLRKQQQMSFDIAQEASSLNITYLPLAEHYRNGFVVKKDLRAAYDYYKKDGALRDSQFRNDDIIKMLNSELRQFDSKINVSPKIEEQTCKTFKEITSAAFCGSDDLEKMFSALSIENIISNSVPLSQADLNGDWISDIPLAVVSTTIKGFDFGGEGIMYASITNGARNLPSSFKYSINGGKLEFDINFSAAGIPVGSKLTFEAWKTKNGALILKTNEKFGVYRLEK